MRLAQRMSEEFKITLPEASSALRAYTRARQEYAEAYGGHPSHAVVKGLEAAEAILKEAGFRSYGVGGICGQSFADHKRPPSMYASIVSYLNTGDIYNVTLMAVGESFRLKIGDVGSVIESCDRRFGRVDGY